jgi:hypothetical protein
MRRHAPQRHFIDAPTVPPAPPALWLRGQIEAHELLNGKIHVPPPVIPTAPPLVTEEVKKSEPNAEAIYAIFNRLRDEFLSDLDK